MQSSHNTNVRTFGNGKLRLWSPSEFFSEKLFLVLVVVVATGIISAPGALVIGIAFRMFFEHPLERQSQRLSRFLLQASVVALGFGMNMHDVLRAGRAGFLFASVSITLTMICGLSLGFLLGVKKTPSMLISAGTAICGGSAIAAIGSLSDATDHDMTVSLGTVFTLNSIALLLFPAIGWALHLSQTQFGLWSALAIHDTSSVVGATSKYGAVALAVGTTVKLARALWILPLSLVLAAARRAQVKIQWPWFIILFCVAAVLNTFTFHPSLYPTLNHLGKIGLCVTLFLIGTGLSKSMLRSVGIRPLLHGLLLWILVGVGTLSLILAGWVRL